VWGGGGGVVGGVVVWGVGGVVGVLLGVGGWGGCLGFGGGRGGAALSVAYRTSTTLTTTSTVWSHRQSMKRNRCRVGCAKKKREGVSKGGRWSPLFRRVVLHEAGKKSASAIMGLASGK